MFGVCGVREKCPARFRFVLALFSAPTGYRFAALVIQGFSLGPLDVYLTTLMSFRPSPHLLHSVSPLIIRGLYAGISITESWSEKPRWGWRRCLESLFDVGVGPAYSHLLWQNPHTAGSEETGFSYWPD